MIKTILVAGALIAAPLPALAQTAAAPSQQSRMSVCNKDAVGKKGDERKAFMKQCLSSPKADAKASSKR